MWRVLKNVLRINKNAGFNITRIHADNEFQSIVDQFDANFNIVFNFASAKEYVPEAEKNYRLIKERVRATFHPLPFVKVMIQVMVMESAKKLIFFSSQRWNFSILQSKNDHV
jgi:hypothetical protein